MTDKRAYVRARRGTASGGHTCHWPGCTRKVPPAMWGCYDHWMMLPREIRALIWASYKPGQEISKTPSPDYVEAARQAQDWIAAHYAPLPQQGKLI